MNLLRAAMARDLRAAITNTAPAAPANDGDPLPEGPVLPLWTAHDGPQREFCESDVDEALYGGAKGGGKSMGAIGLMLPFVGHPDFRGLVLRRTTKGLRDIVKKAKKIFRQGQTSGVRPFAPAAPGCRFVSTGGGGCICYFPSGAEVQFGHCNNEDDWEQYQGNEFHIVCFEELTQFILQQYLEIQSCVRSGVPGLPRWVRSTSNPGGAGHEFVFTRWKWWMDPEAKIVGRAPRLHPVTGKTLPPALPGEVLHIVRNEDGTETAFDCMQFADGKKISRSRTFIPAKLEDNPTLVAEDPSYRLALNDFDPVRRAQLRDGDWLAKAHAGMYFKREWVSSEDRALLPRRPDDIVAWLRYWDRAAGEPSEQNPNPDWTVGTLWGLRRSGHAVVADVKRFRASPMQVKKRIKETAHDDVFELGACAVALEHDPAQAGKFEMAEYLAYLVGYEVIPVPKRKGDDKESWFRPCSRACENGMVQVVKGAWNAVLFDELEAFPFGDKDDQVDTMGGGYTFVCLQGRKGTSKASGSDRKEGSMHRAGGGF